MTAFHGVNGIGTGAESRRQNEEMERLRARVNRQVRRFGFTDAEADQVVDDILDAWNRFAFDPEKSNGAKPETVLTGLVANRCKAAMRALVRRRARDDRYGEAMPTEESDQAIRRDASLKMDVRKAVARLVPQEREICEALANEESRQEICDRLKLNWRQWEDLIDGVRNRFGALGLHEWLKE